MFQRKHVANLLLHLAAKPSCQASSLLQREESEARFKSVMQRHMQRIQVRPIVIDEHTAPTAAQLTQ
jgi:hypothetical protein